jgi:hypothetical protein
MADSDTSAFRLLVNAGIVEEKSSAKAQTVDCLLKELQVLPVRNCAPVHSLLTAPVLAMTDCPSHSPTLRVSS